MNPIATQQAALDNALVPSEKRLKIERCNARIAFSKPQKEETYQVTLEALKLSPCYPAFVITVEGMYNKKNVDYVALLQEDFMYQADNREISSARKEHMPYPRFTKVIINHFISKDKTISMRNRINLHTIRDDSLLGTLKFVSKTQDYQQYGALIPDDMINQDIKDSSAYKTYYDFATGKVPPRKARKYKKVASPPRKLSPVKEAEPVKKAKRVKRPAKKSTTVPIAGVVIRDTPGVSVSKKKAPAKVDTGLLRCSIHTVIIDPHGIRANDDSKYPMQDMLISLLTYLKKSRKFTYKASAQSLKINLVLLVRGCHYQATSFLMARMCHGAGASDVEFCGGILSNIRQTQVKGMIHNDDDGDADAREISRYYETTRGHHEKAKELVMCVEAIGSTPKMEFEEL
ncbi:hypothetical protein Tco_0018458 [Tanacetum coccineum]